MRIFSYTLSVEYYQEIISTDKVYEKILIKNNYIGKLLFDCISKKVRNNLLVISFINFEKESI